jgi:hypothetical protein
MHILELVQFYVSELVLGVNRKTTSTDGYDKFLVFSLRLLELTAVQKTFTLEATVRLGAVSMQHHRLGYQIIDMIETPDVDVSDNALASCKDTVCNKHLFAVTYSNVSI